MALAIDTDAEIALTGEPRRESANRAADPGVAPHPPGEIIFLAHAGGSVTTRPSRPIWLTCFS